MQAKGASNSDKIVSIPEEKESLEESAVKSVYQDPDQPDAQASQNGGASESIEENKISASMPETAKALNNSLSPDEESTTNAPSDIEKNEQKVDQESINETKASDETTRTNEETSPTSKPNDNVDAVLSDQMSSEVFDPSTDEDESRSTTGVESNIRGDEIAGSHSQNETVSGHPVGVNSTDEDENKDVNGDRKDGDGNTNYNIQNESRTDTEDEICTNVDQSIDKNVVNGSQKQDCCQSADDETTENDCEPASRDSDLKTVKESDDKKLEPTKNVSDQSSSTSAKPSKQLLSEQEAKDQDGNLSLNMKSSFIGADTSSSPEDEKPKTNSQNEKLPTDEKASGSTTGTHSSENTSESSGPSAQASPTRNEETGDSGDQYKAYINIPEFMWSSMHQRLLGDLLFAIESDLQVWRR